MRRSEMGLRDRTKGLERRTGLNRPKPCPECGGRIIYVEHHEDGSVTYPVGEPCAVCESTPRIEVMLGAAGGA